MSLPEAVVREKGLESKQILENGGYRHQVCETCSQPEGCDLFGGSMTFYRGCLRSSENTDIYFMIHNSSKSSYEVTTKNVMVGSHYEAGNCIKEG